MGEEEIFDVRNSHAVCGVVFQSLLMGSNLPSEFVLRNCGVIELPSTNLAHLCTQSSAMNNLGPQTVYEEPSTITLVLPRLQTPTPFIRDGVLVKSF